MNKLKIICKLMLIQIQMRNLGNQEKKYVQEVNRSKMWTLRQKMTKEERTRD